MILHRKPVKVAVLTLGLAAIAALAATLALGGAQAGASTITVTKTEDTDGTCTLTDCSLREALKAADSGDGVIVPAGTYTLTLGTELVIDKSLSLNGDGPGQTIIQAAESSADATSRVLNITDGTATISGATIRHGKASGDGGGIASAATVILINTVVSNNIASTNGGGIRNFGGTLTATNTTLKRKHGQRRRRRHR